MGWNLLAWFLAVRWVRGPLIWWAKRNPDTPIRGSDGSLYMERFWLFNPYDRHKRVRRWKHLPSLRIHVIHREDTDRHPHDHPWTFRSFILKGGYISCTTRAPDPTLDLDCGTTPLPAVHLPGSTYAFRVGDYHRIVRMLGSQPATTLVWLGEFKDEWGFLVDGKKVDFREYLK